MEIVDFFNNCYSTGDLCTALWIFTVFVNEMNEGTRQYTEKDSDTEFFFSLRIASLTRVLHLFKNATSLI